MKGLLLVSLAILTPLFLSPSIIFGQSPANSTVNNASNNTGGFAAESVGIADSNARNLTTNTTTAQNNTGGFAAESVGIADSNARNLTTNTMTAQNNTGGFAAESVINSE